FIRNFLRVSIQRCLRPIDGLHHQLPSSLGPLSLGRGKSGELLVPVARNEAVWLGLSRLQPLPVVLFAAVETFEHELINLISGRLWSEDHLAHLVVDKTATIDGVPHSPGTVSALMRCSPNPDLPTCRRIHLLAIPARDVRPKKLRSAQSLNEKSEASPLLIASKHLNTAQSPRWDTEHARHVQLEFVDYSTFANQTGLQVPSLLDPSAGYGGWRLP